jgi:hypothetical protein
MSLFNFDATDTLIFDYSKGTRDEKGDFIVVFADPAALDRALDICLPSRNQLIDQHLAGNEVKLAKSRAVAAYLKNPDAFMTALATRDYGYQPLLPAPAGVGTIPNPESGVDYAKRNKVPLPTEYSANECALIKMGAIGHQDLCRGIRAAFDLLPFEEKTGAGCTDSMAIAVLNHYQEWLEKKDSNTPAKQTCSAPSQAA